MLPLTLDDLTSAFHRVAANEGCAGVDAVTISDFARDLDNHLKTLLRHCQSNTYRPLPLHRIVVEKKPGSTQTRLLLVPTVRDRTLQTAVATQLSRSFEEEFLEASFAYRPGRGVDRAIARIRQLRDDGFWHVVDADIRSYFDNVQHHLLMREVGPRTTPPFDSWIHAWLPSPYWDGQRLRARNKGLPQGGPISPLLASPKSPLQHIDFMGYIRSRVPNPSPTSRGLKRLPHDLSGGGEVDIDSQPLPNKQGTETQLSRVGIGNVPAEMFTTPPQQAGD